MNFVDRYREVGLVRNPFSSQALAERKVFLDRGLPRPAPHTGTMVQLIGDRGFGKSTHLHHWRSAEPGPYHYIPLEPYRHRWSTPPSAPGGIVYGDELDRMPAALRRSWFRALARTQATLVAGTHVDLSSAARRAGLSVVTHVLSPLTRDELVELLTRRFESDSIAPSTRSHDEFSFTEEEVSQIYEISQGVPREIDAACHRLLADRVA